MMNMSIAMSADPNTRQLDHLLCESADLIADSGVCALWQGRQIALFWLPASTPPLYALDNHDPLGGANVLSRGIVGDVKGEPVVASPLYKHHYSLLTGRCLEDDSVAVPVYPVTLRDGIVFIHPQA